MKQLDIVDKLKPGWETAALFRGYTLSRSSAEKSYSILSLVSTKKTLNRMELDLNMQSH